MIRTKLWAVVGMRLDGNGAIPVSTEFSVLPNSFSLVSFLFHFPQCLFYSLQNSSPLPSADDIMPTSQKSSASSSPPSSSSSPKPSSFFVPHLSLYLCTHSPVTLGDFQPLFHTYPNPFPCALDPIASYAQGPPSTQIIPFHTVSPSLPCEVASSFLLCSCFTCWVPTLMDNIAHYPLSCVSPIPGLFNPCSSPLASYVQPGPVIVTPWVALNSCLFFPIATA